MQLGGGNSELMLSWASGCALLPEGLSYQAAAPIFCAGYTVMSGLRNADPKPGERVAIIGLGGLGHLALQFSRAVGPIAIDAMTLMMGQRQLRGSSQDEKSDL